MDEDRLAQLLRRLDEPADPDPAFAEALYRDLRVGGRPPSGTLRSSLLIAAVVGLLTALGVGMAVGFGLIRLPMLVADASPTPAASPAASHSVPSAVETPAATVPPSQPATPSPTPPATPTPRLAIDTLVETTVAGINVRRDPSLGGERLGTLSQDSISFVVNGPVFADGFEWYLLGAPGVPPASGCATAIDSDPYNCPVWFGWAAAADTDGTAWLVAHPTDCPPVSGTLQEMTIMRPPLELLACWPDAELTIRAWSSEPYPPDIQCAAPDEVAWLYCARGIIAWDQGGTTVSAAVDPASGATLPPPGQELELTAHLDDPRAADCAAAAGGSRGLRFWWEHDGEEPQEAVLRCRSVLVITAVSAP